MAEKRNRKYLCHVPVAGLLTLAVMLLMKTTDAGAVCECASCGAAICRSACRTDCNKCCRCCIYFEMRVGRRSVSREVRDLGLLEVTGGPSADGQPRPRRAYWLGDSSDNVGSPASGRQRVDQMERPMSADDNSFATESYQMM